MNPWQSRRWKLSRRKLSAPAEFVINSIGTAVSDITANLLAAWNFETINAGTFAADFGGVTYDLTSVSAPTATAGLNGNAATYDGVANQSSNASTELRLGGGVFSFAFWIKPTLPAATRDFLRYVTTSAGYIFRLSPTGQFSFFTGTGAGYDGVTATDLVATNVWNFIAVTRSAGVVSASVSSTSAFKNQNTAAAATYSPATGTAMLLNGDIALATQYDSMRVYLRALTNVDFKSVWNNGVGLSYPL